GVQVPLRPVPHLPAERGGGLAAPARAALPPLPPGRAPDGGGARALPHGQRARLPLLRLAGTALPPALAPARPGARGAPLLPPRAAGQARAHRPPAMSGLPSEEELADEHRRARQLRPIVDLTLSVIVQGGVSRGEAGAVVA